MTALRRFATTMALLVLATQPASADPDGKRQVIRPHKDSSRKYDIIENGERVGSIRIDKDGDKAKVRDDNGNVKVVIKRDDDKRHDFRVYDGNPNRPKSLGTIERQDDHHGRYDIDDDAGKKIGVIRKRNREKHRGEFVVEYE